MDPETRLGVCQLVAGMIATDGVLRDVEELFLMRVVARLGLSVHDTDLIQPVMGSAEAAARFGVLPADVKGSVLETLIEAALADGEVAAPEMDLLTAIGAAMGASREQVEASVARRLSRSR